MRSILALALLLASAGSAAADHTFSARVNDDAFSLTVSATTGEVTFAWNDDEVVRTGPVADIPPPPFVLVVIDTTEPGVGVFVDDERVL